MSESSCTRVGSMLGEPVDLLSIDTSEPRPWIPGAPGILRPGLRVVWFGSRGSGKSLAAVIASVQVIDAGGAVAYLDWENGPRRQAERLAAILADRPAATRAAVAQHFDYRPAVRLGPLANAQAIAEWAELHKGRALVVIDSAARALGQLGMDENIAADVAKFTTTYIDPIAEQGAAVLLLDNTGHDEQQRTRGSSAKLDLCELAYHVSSDEIAPDRHGEITLDRVRSRDGDEARQLVAHVGEGTYTHLHEPEVGAREVALHETLIEYVREHPGESTEAIAKALHLRLARARDGLSNLEATGTANRQPSRVADGNGRARTRKGWHLAQQSQLAAVPPPRMDTDGYNAAAIPVPPSPPLKAGRGTADHQTAPDHLPNGWTLADFEAIAAEHREAIR